MQKKGYVEILFSLFLVFVFLTAVTIALTQYDRQTRMFPLVIAVPGLLLCIILFASYYFPAISDRISSLKQKEFFQEFDQEEGSDEGEEKTTKKADDQKKLLKEINITLWIIAILIAIYLLGFLIIIPIFTFIFLKFREKENIKISLFVSLGTWAVVYYLFVRVLHAQLYSGLFFN